MSLDVDRTYKKNRLIKDVDLSFYFIKKMLQYFDRKITIFLHTISKFTFISRM